LENPKLLEHFDWFNDGHDTVSWLKRNNHKELAKQMEEKANNLVVLGEVYMSMWEVNGVVIDLEFDGDGFPIVKIDLGGNFYNENMRPTIKVVVDDVTVHEMFDDEDQRWKIT
jgi:hypothetical protein